MEVMEIIDGVTADICINGRPTPILADEGYVGKLRPGDDILVTVQVFPENIWGFSVDSKKNVILKKDYVEFAKKWQEKRNCGNKAVRHNENGKQYRFQTTVQQGWDDIPYAPPAESSMRLLIFGFGAFTNSAGIWEISLVSQEGNFYLRAQRQYFGFLRRWEGILECSEPRINEWPQLMRRIEELL